MTRTLAGRPAGAAPHLAVSAALVAALTAALAAPSSASSQETDVIFVTECIEGHAGWLAPWMTALDAESDLRTRFGDNAPFTDAPDLTSAEEPFHRGQGHYLEDDQRKASEAFEAAYNAYLDLLSASPFCAACQEGATRSGFYWATSLLLRGDRRGARDALEGLYARFPGVEPAPGLYPDRLTRFASEVQQKMRGRRGSLLVNVTPATARVVVNGQPVERRGAEALVRDLLTAEYTVAVGLPGVGVTRQQVDIARGTTVDVDLLATPESLAGECGQPANTDVLYAVNELEDAPGYLVVATDGRAAGQSGNMVWLQTLPEGTVTGAILLPESIESVDEAMAERLADATDQALTTEALEVLRLDDEGRLVEDGDLESSVRGLLNLGAGPNLAPIDPSSPRGAIRLGLSVGTGAGLVTTSEEPGFASSLFMVRPDVGYQLAEALDLGLMVRAQVPQLLLLAHPYVRYRLGGGFNLRGGLALGQVGQTVLSAVTEEGEAIEGYERDEVQGWIGPAAGLEAVISLFVIGVDVYAPLFPDATVQIDLALGATFDL